MTLIDFNIMILISGSLSIGFKPEQKFRELSRLELLTYLGKHLEHHNPAVCSQEGEFYLNAIAVNHVQLIRPGRGTEFYSHKEGYLTVSYEDLMDWQLFNTGERLRVLVEISDRLIQ